MNIKQDIRRINVKREGNLWIEQDIRRMKGNLCRCNTYFLKRFIYPCENLNPDLFRWGYEIKRRFKIFWLIPVLFLKYYMFYYELKKYDTCNDSNYSGMKNAHDPTYDIWNSIKNYKGAVLCKIHR